MVGRLLVGVGIGISAVVVPAYLGEVAPAEARGRIVEVYEVKPCAPTAAAVRTRGSNDFHGKPQTSLRRGHAALLHSRQDMSLGIRNEQCVLASRAET